MFTITAGFDSKGTRYTQHTANLFQCALRLSEGGVAPMDFDEKDELWKPLAGRMQSAMGKHSLKVMTVSEKKDTQPLPAHIGSNFTPAAHIGLIPPPMHHIGSIPSTMHHYGTHLQCQITDRPDVKRKASTAPTMLPPPPPKLQKVEGAGNRTSPLHGLPYRLLENR